MPGAERAAPAVSVVLAGAAHSGGVRNVAVAQARMLARRFDVRIVSDGCPDLALEGLPCSSIPVRSFDWLRRFGHVPREYFRSRALARAAIAPGGVIISHAHAISAALPGMCGGRRPPPNLLVVHGDIFTRPRGTYDPMLTTFYRQMTRAAYRVADLVVVPTFDMANRVTAAGADRDRIRIIPYVLERLGVEESSARVARTYPAVVSSEFCVLYVGRLAPEKSVGTLLEAVALLHDAKRSLRLVIVGDGTDATGLKAIAAGLGIAECVEFRGWRPRYELAQIYGQADCMCVPSLDDPFPTVILEAFSKGLPVVASRVAGIPEMVQHGRTGLLFAAGDVRDLMQNIERLMDERQTRQDLGLAGAAWLRNNLAPDVVAPIFCDAVIEAAAKKT